MISSRSITKIFVYVFDYLRPVLQEFVVGRDYAPILHHYESVIWLGIPVAAFFHLR